MDEGTGGASRTSLTRETGLVDVEVQHIPPMIVSRSERPEAAVMIQPCGRVEAPVDVHDGGLVS